MGRVSVRPFRTLFAARTQPGRILPAWVGRLKTSFISPSLRLQSLLQGRTARYDILLGHSLLLLPRKARNNCILLFKICGADSGLVPYLVAVSKALPRSDPSPHSGNNQPPTS